MAYTVLIVDDTNFMRKMLADCLRQYGYVIAGEAANGREAIRLYEELRPDIVMMDLTMPEMNGIDAIKGIFARHPDAVVLICSASNQQELIFDALDAGAKGYVMKPFKPENVDEVIRKFAAPHLPPAPDDGDVDEGAREHANEPEQDGNAREHADEPKREGIEISSIVGTAANEAEQSVSPQVPADAEETTVHVQADSRRELAEAEAAAALAAPDIAPKDSGIIIDLFRRGGKMKNFVSSAMCNWQEERNGEPAQYMAIYTESEDRLVIELSCAGKDKQQVTFSMDGFRQLSSWFESQTANKVAVFEAGPR